MPEFVITIIIVIAGIIFLSIFFSFVPVGLFISARASGVKVGIGQLAAMRIRKVTPSRIINPMIKATKAGMDVPLNKLEAHYLAGGNVDRVVNALIAAQRAGIPLDFERACAIDLAGRDVLNAVQMSVNPKVIETPVIAARYRARQYRQACRRRGRGNHNRPYRRRYSYHRRLFHQP